MLSPTDCDRPPEFIPLAGPDVQKENRKNNVRTKAAKCENKASTRDLNNSSNLDVLENNRCMPWLKKSKDYKSFNPIQCLHEEIKDFGDYIAPTNEEQRMREHVVQKISDVIHQLWDFARVEIFGSFRTGLFLPTSDIDIVVFGNWDQLPLRTLEQAIVDRGIADRDNIKVLDRASVPIIKVVDKATEVKVDISFNMTNGVRSVEMIQTYLESFPLARYLAFVLKQFLLQRDLNEVYTGGISSYCLLYLIISFMQLHPRADAMKPDANLGVLLMEFFELYGIHFNYMNVGIRVSGGGSYIPKSEVQRSLTPQGAAPSLLYIEDPLDPSNDIGRSSYGMLRVKQAFEYAYYALQNAVIPPDTYAFTCSSSVLARIIRVTDEVVHYRKWIKDHYPSLVPLSFCAGGATARSMSAPAASRSYASAVRASTPTSIPVVSASSPRAAKNLNKGDVPSDSADEASASPRSSLSSSSVASSEAASDTEPNADAMPKRKKVAGRACVTSVSLPPSGSKQPPLGGAHHPPRTSAGHGQPLQGGAAATAEPPQPGAAASAAKLPKSGQPAQATSAAAAEPVVQPQAAAFRPASAKAAQAVGGPAAVSSAPSHKRTSLQPRRSRPPQSHTKTFVNSSVASGNAHGATYQAGGCPVRTLPKQSVASGGGGTGGSSSRPPPPSFAQDDSR